MRATTIATLALCAIAALASADLTAAQGRQGGQVKTTTGDASGRNAGESGTGASVATNGDDASSSSSSSSSSTPESDKQKVHDEVKDVLDHYAWAVAATSIAVGLVFNFFGYKFFPGTMFLAGAAAGGCLVYYFTFTYINDDVSNKSAIVVGTSVAAGLILGVLAWKLRKVGIFAAGAVGGVAGAFALNAAVLCHLPTPNGMSPKVYLYGAAAILGLVGGVLAFKLERHIVILATTLAGSLGAILGAKFFIDGETLAKTNTHSSAQVWYYLGGLVALVLLGLFVQYKYTAPSSHKKRVHARTGSLLHYEAPSAATGYNTQPVVINVENGGPISKV